MFCAFHILCPQVFFTGIKDFLDKALISLSFSWSPFSALALSPISAFTCVLNCASLPQQQWEGASLPGLSCPRGLLGSLCSCLRCTFQPVRGTVLGVGPMACCKSFGPLLGALGHVSDALPVQCCLLSRRPSALL